MEGERGFGVERVVKIVRKGGGKDEWQVRYHLTDPVKISMVEKAELVDRVVDVADKVNRTMGDRATVVFVTMLPRFVRECCKGHMVDEDVWLLDGVRRDLKKKIVDRLVDMGVEVVNWWTLLRSRDELILSDVKRLYCVDKDIVRLNWRANTLAAEILFTRLEELKKADKKTNNAMKKRPMK